MSRLLVDWLNSGQVLVVHFDLFRSLFDGRGEKEKSEAALCQLGVRVSSCLDRCLPVVVVVVVKLICLITSPPKLMLSTSTAAVLCFVWKTTASHGNDDDDQRWQPTHTPFSPFSSRSDSWQW